jgi:nucleoside-diphosphate-sugar epimerase
MHPIVAEDLTNITAAALPWQEFSGATVLVTGAAGFLPAYMVETLLHLNRTILAKPARVIALVRNAERGRERFAEYTDRPDFHIHEQDVSQPLALDEPLDYIIHAASQASPVFYRTDPVGTLAPNVLGTHHLLNAAHRHNAKGFLYFSSGEIYGIIPPGAGGISETSGGWLDPTDLRSCYGESKRMGETMCVAFARQFNVPTRIARPFHTYGPGMRLDDGRSFADFVRDILAGGPITLMSDGSARRSFCYLADATLGFFTVLLQGAPGEAYNVANPDGETSIAELAERLAAACGLQVERRARTGNTYMPSPILSTKPDIAKANALGWDPRIGLEEGFARTVASYR